MMSARAPLTSTPQADLTTSYASQNITKISKGSPPTSTSMYGLASGNSINSPPVRDSATLKGVNYSGVGHEKYPSWPMAAAAEVPLAVRAPATGGSHRSKSWTDHTNYPKEQPPMPMRPYMKRSHAASVGTPTQHLKTVMERTEQHRIVPNTEIASTYEQFDSTRLIPIHDDSDKRSNSPPERDTDQMTIRGLSKKDLDTYNTSYAESTVSQDTGKFSPTSSQLTRADLEEYTRTYDEVLTTQHVKQSSYAQSEGYHSYVSSTDSMSTPFLDRLRRDSALNTLSGDSISREGRDSVATIHSCSDSVVTSNSGSSSETLKWHGSMSDVSVASSSMGTATSRSHIAHSAKVKTPQRHNSESVLYINGAPVNGTSEEQAKPRTRLDRQNSKLFPVSTYIVKPTTNGQENKAPRSPPQVQPSVAERINELERQQSTRFSFLGPAKRHKISDPALKAIQKKALLSFYERHNSTNANKNVSNTSSKQSQNTSQTNHLRSESIISSNTNTVNGTDAVNIKQNGTNKESWRSEPHLARPLQAPPPVTQAMTMRPRTHSSSQSISSSRRASTASEYSGWREANAQNQEHNLSIRSDQKQVPSEALPQNHVRQTSVPHESPPLILPQYDQTSSCKACIGVNIIHTCTLTPKLKGPVVLGPSINVDNWAPQRPPKNPALRSIYQTGKTSPEPPLPSPPTVTEDEVFVGDEPFPPPPPNVLDCWDANSQRDLNKLNKSTPRRSPPVQPSRRNSFANARGSHFEHRLADVRASVRHKPVPVVPVQTKPEQRSPPPPPLQPRQPRIRSGSHSKASYLSHRRDNDLSLPNPDHGSYKLTISPSGESLERNSLEDSLIDNKMTTLIHHHNNNNSCHNLLQRVSASLGSLNGLNKAADLINNLPDVLPMNAKVPRSTRSSAPNTYMHPIDNQLKTINGNSLKISPPNTPRNIQQSRFSLESSLRQYNNINTNIQSARVTPMRTEYVQPLISPKQETKFVEPIKLESSLPSPDHLVTEPFFSEQNEEEHNLGISENGKDEIATSPVKSEPLPVQFAANCIEVTRHVAQQSPIQEENHMNDNENYSMKMTDRACSPVHSDPESPKSVRSTRSHLSNNASPVQKEVAEVQPMQRTELVLRVNSYTSDAASQTEKEDLLTAQIVKTPLLPRQKSPEEIDCEELSRDFVSHLSPTDRLQGILGSSPEHKEPADYVTGLFQLEISRPIKSRLSSTSDSISKSCSDLSTRSESQGILNDDLLRKKDELVARLDSKLRVLRAEQLAVTDELTLNDKLGVTVLARVERLALASEAAKYRQHVQEVSQITGLLLGLSSRLARAENSLLSMPCSLTDKRNLEVKRDKLQEQLEEAKRLKENIDKRSKNVSQMLTKYLSSEEYADYDHFINMKAKLIMDSREIANKIQLGEEQLHALSEHN